MAALVAAVIAGAVVLALALSGGDDEKDRATQAQTTAPTTTAPTTTTETTPTTTEEGGGDAPEDIPAATKRRFIRLCQNRGRPRAQCRCTINELDRVYDYIEFVVVFQRAQRTKKLPAKARRAVQRCAR